MSIYNRPCIEQWLASVAVYDSSVRAALCAAVSLGVKLYKSAIDFIDRCLFFLVYIIALFAFSRPLSLSEIGSPLARLRKRDKLRYTSYFYAVLIQSLLIWPIFDFNYYSNLIKYFFFFLNFWGTLQIYLLS